MKSCRSLSVFLLCNYLCLLAGFAVPASAASPPVPRQQAARDAAGDADRPSQSAAPDESSKPEEASIPGPLRSFLRMAAISQKITPEEVLPLLARNVVMSGYQAGTAPEFLVLLDWF